MKNILITGANGYVGKIFQNYLSNNSSDNVIGIDKRKYDNQNVKFLDLLDFPEVSKLIERERIDIIFNFAGVIKAKNFDDYYEGNVLTTRNILESIKHNKNIRLFIIGTADQYGNSYSNPISENFSTQPISLYGLSKKFQEEFGLYYLNKFKLDIVFLRIFNIYGENQSINFIIPKFIKKIVDSIHGNKVVEDIDLEFYRDFIYIYDLCEILVKLINRTERGEVINIGTGKCISIKDILKHLCQYSKSDIRVIYKLMEYGPDDIIYQVANIDKLKTMIGDFKFTDFFKKLKELYTNHLNDMNKHKSI